MCRRRLQGRPGRSCRTPICWRPLITSRLLRTCLAARFMRHGRPISLLTLTRRRCYRWRSIATRNSTVRMMGLDAVVDGGRCEPEPSCQLCLLGQACAYAGRDYPSHHCKYACPGRGLRSATRSSSCTSGSPEEAAKVWDSVKGKSTQIPDATVIAATESSVQVAVSDDAVQSKTADFTFNIGCSAEDGTYAWIEGYDLGNLCFVYPVTSHDYDERRGDCRAQEGFGYKQEIDSTL